MAVGIGAVTAVFTFVDSAFYRPLPFPNADRIVTLTTISAKRRWAWSRLPKEVVDLVRDGATSFERTAAFAEDRGQTLVVGSSPSIVGVTAIDTAVLPLLAARAQRGRLITRAEIAEGAPVALISDSLWRTVFQRQDRAVGMTVALNGVTTYIVGVLPVGFRFYLRSDVLVPLSEPRDTLPPGEGLVYSMLGLLKPGIGLATAQQEVRRLGRNLAAADPRFRRWDILVQDGMYEGRENPLLQGFALIFAAIATCVLLVAGTNVSNLLMFRARERLWEVAVRSALGATSGRILRLGFVDSLLLSSLAGLLGFGIAWVTQHVVVASVPLQGVPSWIRLGIDFRVAAFAAVLALLTSFAVGIQPALMAWRADLTSVLKTGDVGIVGSARALRGGRQGVIVQVALSLALAVAASLIWRSYANLRLFDLGYPARLVFRTDIQLNRATHARQADAERFYLSLAERAASLPGVAGVALRGTWDQLAIDSTSETGTGQPRRNLAELSRDDADGVFLSNDINRIDNDIRIRLRRWAVTDGYFGTLGLSLQSGRLFDGREQLTTVPVAIVSAEFARLVWPGASPLGREFRTTKFGHPITVVGLVSNTRAVYAGLEGTAAEPVPAIYMSYRQVVTGNYKLLLRADNANSYIAGPLRAAVTELEPDAVSAPLQTLADDELRGLLVLRLLGTLIGVFGALAVLLAGVGTFSVVSQSVTLRRREVGLRMALGATSRDVSAMFVREGIHLFLRGVLLGLPLAAFVGAVLQRFLAGVSSFDPVSYGIAILLFAGLALVACYLPSARAARTEPLTALRVG